MNEKIKIVVYTINTIGNHMTNLLTNASYCKFDKKTFNIVELIPRIYWT